MLKTSDELAHLVTETARSKYEEEEDLGFFFFRKHITTLVTKFYCVFLQSYVTLLVCVVFCG